MMATVVRPQLAARMCLRQPRSSLLPTSSRCFSTSPRRPFKVSSCFFSASRPGTRPTSASPTTLSRTTILLAGVSLVSFAGAAFFSPASLDATHAHQAFSASNSPTASAEASGKDDDDDNLPRFRLSEIRQHDGSSKNPWVVYGSGVYDITDWIPAHPGGDVILRAAGGSIDAYWDIFTIHKQDYVRDILATYLIGRVHASDLSPDGVVADLVQDPFADDPRRHAHLITRTEKPQNAETPGYALDDSFLTPNDLFYIRNHMWVPTVDGDPEQHTLTVELPDGSTRVYTLDELKARFPHRSVTAVLQCSGNRRADMSNGSNRKANGLPWETGAISNATWQGASLADVLADAGYDNDDNGNDDNDSDSDNKVKHVQFSGMEAYAASIPIRKALDPYGDVLLAWSMNGAPLPRDHGFPLRSVVPGHVAARSVKWLSRITLSDEESTSQWQRRDYKCFGPNQINVDWDTAPAIQEMPVQSAITAVKLHASQQPTAASKNEKDKEAEVPKGKKDTDGKAVSLGGYAYSGGGRAIVRVDVSLDDGATWSQAHLLPDCQGATSQCAGHAAWAWKRWRFTGVIPPAAFMPVAEGSPSGAPERLCTNLVVKATDESYNTQPESHAATWNVRGNLATAWHRVQVCSDCQPGLLKTVPPAPEK